LVDPRWYPPRYDGNDSKRGEAVVQASVIIDVAQRGDDDSTASGEGDAMR